jgi:hypothetical protein
MPSNRSRSVAVTVRALSLGSIALAWLGGSVCGSRSAAAAPTSGGGHSSQELQAARELFASAEADEDAGRWDVALDKLHRVLATKDTAGVRYHVALCEERLGRLASAEAEYAVAETSARAEQARDVLTLVGKKRADLAPRVPHVTVRVLPQRAAADVSIDGIGARAGEATAVNPGSHEVVVVPDDGRSPSKTPFAIGDGETKTVDVMLAPAPEQPAPAAGAVAGAAPVAGEARRPPAGTLGGGRVAAIVEGAGALVLTGAGFGAYFASSAARDQGARYCALASAPSSASCDAYRVPVRAWDWAALGAWAGAAALGGWAVVTWVRAPRAPARVEVGAASLRVEGAF